MGRGTWNERGRGRRERIRIAGGYLVTAALLAVVLSQVPWAVVASALGGDVPTYDDAARSATAPTTVTAAADEHAQEQTGPGAGGPASAAAQPWRGRLRVEAWDRTFPVTDVSVRDDGALVPPDDVDALGRWDRGARPGDGTGAVVLVVHRDSSAEGRGPFAALGDLPRASTVTLTGTTYELADVTTYAKDRLPAARVFGQEGRERLVIVTCGGSYSTTRGWDSNVVATFVPSAG
ncbi:class F sortase [Nocardioides sp. T2.26MG-1]|uniref:class F sortase n=1 Tax=Nocardioides sp. T2.26MG-1 TaxID=3041166 RepID=UPI00254049DD|nr:class F sortase [Nocardioides sp. T2.26MG-1]